MKRLLVLVVVLLFAPATWAKVWTTVYCCDEKTPLAPLDPNHSTVYRDVMVGTRLVIIVSSDTGGYWLGSLLLSWDDANFATLSARGYTTTVPGSTAFYPNYTGSCLDAAGGKARVRSYARNEGIGFELSTANSPPSSGNPPAVAGDWFVIDYRADRVGTCDVALYDWYVSRSVPIQTLSFTHVPSRDFSGDALVDFQDFALFASQWDSTRSPDPNSPDAAFDLDGDAQVDFHDLALFSEYWLERTDCSQAGDDPNSLSPGP